MHHQDHCEKLVQEIDAWLSRGIHPDPGVRHYIDSTFALPTRRDLEAILSDPDNCERDTLVELILFPGQDIQLLLEDLIEQSRFRQEDAERILALLMKKKTGVALHYPKGGKPVCFDLPENAAAQFIARLNICKRITGSVREAIRENLPLDWQKPTRVMIRNARFDCRGDSAAFLEAFMRRMPPVADDFFGHLEFVLAFLETHPDGTPLKEALALCKQRHQKNIIKAEQFERQRQNRNVETMIMQGIRIPHFDSRDDMRKIAMIDTISIALYGKILQQPTS